MTQVLTFGLPTRERILCEAPACEELATSCTTFIGTDHELFSCQRHYQGLVAVRAGSQVKRFLVLKTPGERNAKEEEAKKDA